jgi:hypothetical protein
MHERWGMHFGWFILTVFQWPRSKRFDRLIVDHRGTSSAGATLRRHMLPRLSNESGIFIYYHGCFSILSLT